MNITNKITGSETATKRQEIKNHYINNYTYTGIIGTTSKPK